MEALDVVHISKEDQETIFAMLATVLWLGNISFTVIDNEGHVQAVENESLSHVAELIGCDLKDLKLTLSTRNVKVGNDKIVQKLTLSQEIDARDALAKFMYSCLFDWNHFEQFCINYANERLQQHFHRHLFKLEQEEYIHDGIDWAKVEFEDNQDCLNLFEKRPLGLLSLLDEESTFPNGTYLTFANKLKQHLNSKSCFKGERDQAFSVCHYAGRDSVLTNKRNVTYGDIYPLGVRQRGILVNGRFPGPDIHSVTNDNFITNVFNSLDEPFLLSWNGIQQRRNSFEDGVFGTTSGGFGGIRILSRPRIPVPFPDPSGDYTVLFIGDWYKSNHTTLKAHLDRGKKLPIPDGILINGRGPNGLSFNIEQGKTYRLRISNMGLQHSLNFRSQNHKMNLVEFGGTHTLQTTYSSLDVHVGQSYSVLVTADQPSQDYYIVVSTRFSAKILTTTGVLRYSNSTGPISGPPPGGSTIQVDWFLNQARSIRTNLTANGPRPNPQGSYHYGLINTTKIIILSSSPGQVNGKQRYAISSVSYISPDTPLKLADYFKISGVFRVGSIFDRPTGGGIYLDTSVFQPDYRSFIEIVFQNNENIVQSYHPDGYSFFVKNVSSGKLAKVKGSFKLSAAAKKSAVDKPKLLSQLSALVSDIGLNIREAHVFSITDGYSLNAPRLQPYFRLYTPPSWKHQTTHIIFK
ncbi:hypothetical protein KIW84_022674 [Lathyrus oleraceus]|uniref:Myosin motor domain-containing protein n=1 Tax=Pisum sativum TaxID=3888 RepID=A0A9D4YGV2_PEA|nr:hypothetical protein KIW84_022674 [Pisum sativum]